MITASDLNTYGRYARASLLADLVELLALKGEPVKRAVLADFLADTSLDFELIQSAESDTADSDATPLSERLDGAHESASVVFEQINERHNVLACRYPFETTGETVTYNGSVDFEESAYIAVLAITLAHAYSVQSQHQPHEMFERIVAKVLRLRGLLASGMAAHRRAGGTFESALQNACKEAGLKATPNAVPRRKRAHDEGVDILSHFRWEEELRPGTWGFIGQVTVGSSDSWEKKINEPSPNQWKSLTGTWVPPSPFLAVPHHVERSTMEWLTSKSEAIVLDRLRLVGYKDEIEADERDIIQAVIREDVEPLAG